METKGRVQRLRIYISSTDRFKSSQLYEVLVYAAKRYGLAGATVVKGVMGYGASSSISSVKFWDITEKLPVIVEIVDEPDRIELFTKKILPWFDNIRYGCIITVEDVGLVLHRKGKRGGS